MRLDVLFVTVTGKARMRRRFSQRGGDLTSLVPGQLECRPLRDSIFPTHGFRP